MGSNLYDALMTVAAVDWIIHHASIIEIKRGSYRKKQHLKKQRNSTGHLNCCQTGQDS